MQLSLNPYFVLLMATTMCNAFVPWAPILRAQQIQQFISRSSSFPPYMAVNGENQEQSKNSLISNITLDNEVTLEFQLHSSVASIPAEAWDACLHHGSAAFLDHAWLRCLEESKCVSPQTGWVPQHVSIKIDNETMGFIPLYIKGHSSKCDVSFAFVSSWLFLLRI